MEEEERRGRREKEEEKEVEGRWRRRRRYNVEAKAEKLMGAKAWEWSPLKCEQGLSRWVCLSLGNKHTISLPEFGDLKSWPSSKHIPQVRPGVAHLANSRCQRCVLRGGGEGSCLTKAKTRRDAITHDRLWEVHLPEQTASLQSLKERIMKDRDGNGSWYGLCIYHYQASVGALGCRSSSPTLWTSHATDRAKDNLQRFMGGTL